ncbi:DUF397 domain-containing protein [Kitasatospora sp. NPDC092286]|uniref:DUF397 domain-containing protein n=1 Tax=Kitasatospora sp. NPDC092286 TaxID=3364087 RepID=UPI003805F26E
MDVDLTGARWKKSSYSGSGGQCIETADNYPGIMPVRDSKDPSGPALLFPASSWQSFITAVRTGEFDTH